MLRRHRPFAILKFLAIQGAADGTGASIKRGDVTVFLGDVLIGLIYLLAGGIGYLVDAGANEGYDLVVGYGSGLAACCYQLANGLGPLAKLQAAN